MKQVLPAWMINRANRFKRWEDSQAYLLGKFLLTKALENCGFKASVLNKLQLTKYGRPYLHQGIDFNIAHSGGYVVCAISTHYKVGIDIEEVRDIDVSDFVNQFTEHELHSINNAYNRNAEFFRYWTMKEALAKADGRGLSMPLKNILTSVPQVSEDHSWHIYRVNIDDDYIAHLVVNTLLHHELAPKKVLFPVA